MDINSRFFFREAIDTDEDYNVYLRLKSDSEAVKYSGFISAPDPEHFKSVYKRILNDEKQHLLYLCDIQSENRVAASFHYSETDPFTVEGLGYNVFPEYRGMGLGGIMMKLVNEKCANEGFKYRMSYVAETNLPSIKNLIKSGAHPTGKFMFKELAALGRKVKYLEYIKEL